jgi:hypothetical protein
MKKLIYSFATVLVALTSCISFDDPTTENYGAGPSVDVSISAGIVTDSAFQVTVTPAEGALYYAFAVSEGDAPEALDSMALYKGSYGNTVLKASDYPSYFFVIDDADPNSTYWVYAVAGNDKGIVGNMTVKSITTTDGEAPYPMGIAKDADSGAVQLTFSEAVQLGAGAVTAKYYQEWDILNPVDVAAENIAVSVSGSKVLFEAAGVPAGAYLCYSYEAGAFKDMKGIACGALNSGLNMDAGKFTGAYVHVTNKPFAIDDSFVTAPEDGALINNADLFEGIISFPFDIFRNDDEVKVGDLVIAFANGNKTTAYNLDPSLWSVEDNLLKFYLPEQPEVGDQIFVSVKEGVVYDVCGNPNLAYTSVANWKYFPLTVDYFVGKFGLDYISYFDDSQSVTNLGVVTIEEDAESGDGALAIKDFYMEGSVLSGAYDLSAGLLLLNDGQVLGFAEEDGTVYGLAFVNAEGDGPVTFTLNPNGTMTADGMWGIYAYDQNFEEAVGWWDVAAASQLSPLDGAARKAAARKAVKKTKNVKFVKKNISRDLNKRVRK